LAGRPLAGQRRMPRGLFSLDRFWLAEGFPANAFLRMPACRRLSS
jgi:hypothetical protein